MNTALANFLFEAVNFLILAAALGYFFFKPVRASLDREQGHRAVAEAETARVRAEADELASKAQAAWATADAGIADHRERLLSAAREEASRLKERARDEQVAERLSFDQQLRAARQTQADDLASAIGEVSAAAVYRLLGSIGGPDLDTALVRAACDELGSGAPASGAPVEVESARPLSADAVAALSGVLGAGLTTRVVPELGAGVRITTPAGQVDATAAGFARQAARGLTRTIRDGLDGGDGG